MALLLLSCKSLQVSGVSFLMYCLSLSFTESFCYSTRFYPFLLGKCWFSPILLHVSHETTSASFVQAKKKKKIHTFILPQNLVVQHHQHCLAIRVQYLSEPKKVQPTVPPKPRCSRAHLHWLAVLALRAGQSPSPRAGSDGLVPLCPPKHITAPTPSTELETDAPTRLMWL